MAISAIHSEVVTVDAKNIRYDLAYDSASQQMVLGLRRAQKIDADRWVDDPTSDLKIWVGTPPAHPAIQALATMCETIRLKYHPEAVGDYSVRFTSRIRNTDGWLVAQGDIAWRVAGAETATIFTVPNLESMYLDWYSRGETALFQSCLACWDALDSLVATINAAEGLV